MGTNKLVYGAWGLILIVAVGVAGWEMSAESPGAAVVVEQPSNLAVSREPGLLQVQPATFAQDQTPGRLPVVSDTDPLANTKLKALRRIVAAEMPGASEAEKDVWTEQFRDLPEETVRFLLKQKRTSDGIPDPIALAPDPSAAPTAAEDTDSSAATRNTLRIARQVLSGNLLNGATTGYRRRLVEFHPTRIDGRTGLEIAEIRWQMSPGPRTETRRTFDFAIRDTGFFAVSDGEQTYFTRAGRFRLNAQRQLVLPIGDRELTVVGVNPIPQGAMGVSVTPDGDVTATTEEGAVEVGRVAVANFLDASRLHSLEGCLFTPTAASGSPTYDGLSAIDQGMIEGSNAHTNSETMLLQQLDRWEQLITR